MGSQEVTAATALRSFLKSFHPAMHRPSLAPDRPGDRDPHRAEPVATGVPWIEFMHYPGNEPGRPVREWKR